MSGRGVGKVVDVKSSEAEQGDQKEEDMVVSERTSGGGGLRVGREMYYI